MKPTCGAPQIEDPLRKCHLDRGHKGDHEDGVYHWQNFEPGAYDNKEERVNHPPHYGGAENPYEAIKVIEAWGLGFCLGNTVKYIARAGKKDVERLNGAGVKAKTLEDLEKARWYLNREIQRLRLEP